MATHIHHESHGNHPMSLVAVMLLIVGGTFSALWLITLTELPENKPTNIAYGVIALSCLLLATAIYTTLTRRLHHSPMMPDNTPQEIRRYLSRVR